LTRSSRSASAKLEKKVSSSINPYLPTIIVFGAEVEAGAGAAYVRAAGAAAAEAYPSDSASDNGRESWEEESAEEALRLDGGAFAAATRSSSNPESEVRSCRPDGWAAAAARRGGDRGARPSLPERLTWSEEEDVVVFVMARLRGGLDDTSSRRVPAFALLLRAFCSRIGSTS